MIKTLNQLLPHHFPEQNFQKLGEGSWYSWKRHFISCQNGQWSVVTLNIFQRIVRTAFKYYQSTHLFFVITKINADNVQLPPAFINRIRQLWEKTYPQVYFPYVQPTELLQTSHAQNTPKQNHVEALPTAMPKSTVLYTPQVESIPSLTFATLEDCSHVSKPLVDIPHVGKVSSKMISLILKNKETVTEEELNGSLLLELKGKSLQINGLTKCALGAVSEVLFDLFNETKHQQECQLTVPESDFEGDLKNGLSESDWQLLLKLLFSDEVIPNDQILKAFEMCYIYDIDLTLLDKKDFFVALTNKLFQIPINLSNFASILKILIWVETKLGNFYEKKLMKFLNDCLISSPTLPAALFKKLHTNPLILLRYHAHLKVKKFKKSEKEKVSQRLYDLAKCLNQKELSNFIFILLDNPTINRAFITKFKDDFTKELSRALNVVNDRLDTFILRFFDLLATLESEQRDILIYNFLSGLIEENRGLSLDLPTKKILEHREISIRKIKLAFSTFFQRFSALSDIEGIVHSVINYTVLEVIVGAIPENKVEWSNFKNTLNLRIAKMKAENAQRIPHQEELNTIN